MSGVLLGSRLRQVALLLGSARTMAAATSDKALNVLGQPLAKCCSSPVTGWYRDGFCHTDANDHGSHVVCARMTQDFLHYTKAQGNDLSTPRPPSFPGLKPGDCWCLCAIRWREALDAGVAPPVNLAACHKKALEVVTLEQLKAHMIQTDDSGPKPNATKSEL